MDFKVTKLAKSLPLKKRQMHKKQTGNHPPSRRDIQGVATATVYLHKFLLFRHDFVS